MTKQQRIQAAIDALPHASTGDWRKRLTSDPLQPQDMWCIDWTDDHEEVAEGVYGEANATILEAAEDLAEEVVRLRALVKEAFGKGFFHGHRDGGCQSWDDV